MATCHLPKVMAGATAFEDTLYSVVETTIYREDCDEEDKMACPLRLVKDGFPFRRFQIWVFKDDETEVVTYSVVNDGRPLDQDELREYLLKEATTELEELPRRASGKTLLGGIRLLVQEWPRRWDPEGEGELHMDYSSEVDSEDVHFSSDSFVNWLTPQQTRIDGDKHHMAKGYLPFSRYTLQRLTNAFHIPKGYSLDLLGEIGIPMRLSWIDYASTDDEMSLDTNMGIVVQSPKYDDERCFISTALSYDAKHNVTSGFFGYVSSGPPNDEQWSMHEILQLLQSPQFAPEATHPMLLPTLLLRHIYGANVARLESARNTLHTVEDQVRGMETLFASGQDLIKSSISLEVPGPDKCAIEKSYSALNQELVKNHTTLMNEGFSFAQTLLANNIYGLGAVRKMREREKKQGMNRIDERELESFLLQLKGYIASYTYRRTRLLSRINVAFHELFNVTQFLLQQSDVRYSHKTARIAEKYNRVIMAFSVMSAFFLPASSIATIFGMVEFFDVDKSNDNVLNVSPAWIVYWKVTIPLTVVLVLGLFGWFNIQRLPPPPPRLFPPPKGLRSLLTRFPWGPPPPGQYSVDDEKRLRSIGSSESDEGGMSFWAERSRAHQANVSKLNSVSVIG